MSKESLANSQGGVQEEMNELFLFVFFCKRRASQLIMDVEKNNVDDIIKSAEDAREKGNYKEAISILEPLLKGERKNCLSAKDERTIVRILSDSHRFMEDFKRA